jgi:hypothetical protein
MNTEMLRDIRAGAPLHRTRAAPAAASVAPRSAILAQVRGGANLRHVEPPISAQSGALGSTFGGLAKGLLGNVVAAHNNIVATAVDCATTTTTAATTAANTAMTNLNNLTNVVKRRPSTADAPSASNRSALSADDEDEDEVLATGCAFGRPLRTLDLEEDDDTGLRVPSVLVALWSELRRRHVAGGLHCEGLFRLSAPASEVAAFKRALQTDGRAAALSTASPEALAALIKLFLRELPDDVRAQGSPHTHSPLQPCTLGPGITPCTHSPLPGLRDHTVHALSTALRPPLLTVACAVTPSHCHPCPLFS